LKGLDIVYSVNRLDSNFLLASYQWRGLGAVCNIYFEKYTRISLSGKEFPKNCYRYAGFTTREKNDKVVIRYDKLANYFNIYYE
jgi:hypothetical protein